MSFTWEGKQLENRRLVNDYTNEVYLLAESPVSGLGVSTKIITLQLVSDMSQGSLRFPGLPVSTKLVIVQFGAALWVTIVKKWC